MKLLPAPRRVSLDDSIGHGMDAALTMALMILIGFGLDSWLDTTPLCTIGLSLLGAVGLFARFRYTYEARMDELEAQRREQARSRRS